VFEHLRSLFELLLELLIAYDLGCLGHLTQKFPETPEDSDETAFKLVGELTKAG
jgi:hypothetical protein